MTQLGNIIRSGIDFGSMPDQPTQAQPRQEMVPVAEPQALIPGLDYKYEEGQLMWAKYIPDDIKAASTLPRTLDTEPISISEGTDYGDVRVQWRGDDVSFEGTVQTTFSSLAAKLGNLGGIAAAGGPTASQPGTTRGEVVVAPSARPPKQLSRKASSQPEHDPARDSLRDKTDLYEGGQNRKRMDPKVPRWILANLVAFPLVLDSCLALGMGAVTVATPLENHAHGVIVNFSHFPGLDLPTTAVGRIRHPSKLFGP